MADQVGTRTRIARSRWLGTVATVTLTFVLGMIGLSSCLLKPPRPDDPLQPVLPPAVGLPNAYACNCACAGTGGKQFTPQFTVCYPDKLNPVLGGTAPDPASLQAVLQQDCSARVEVNVDQLSKACVASAIDCLCNAVSGSSTFAFECNDPCQENVLATDCSNFNPFATPPVKTATNVFSKPPVCLAASSDPPTPVPDPLVAGVFGHRTRCEVTGTVTLTSGSDTQTQHASGWCCSPAARARGRAVTWACRTGSTT